MSKKRVHEIAKEQGMSPKVALARMQAAGLKVGAASSSVDEDAALRALGNGGAQATETNGSAKPADAPSPATVASTDGAPSDAAAGDGAGRAGAPKTEGEGYKRPTRDSLQGERAPGAASGRRRVVIDSQASRRAPGGGPQQQPPRRQRRGRRRRGV